MGWVDWYQAAGKREKGGSAAITLHMHTVRYACVM